jgi:hypothetical protein
LLNNPSSHLARWIRLEDKEHVNFMRVRRDWVELLRHILDKKRILMNLKVGWQIKNDPVRRIYLTETWGRFTGLT